MEDVEFLDVHNFSRILPTIHRWPNLKRMTIRYFELTNDCIPNTSAECIVIDGLQMDQSSSRLMRWTIDNLSSLEAILKVLCTNFFQLISTFLSLRSLRFLIPFQTMNSIFHGEDLRQIWEKCLKKKGDTLMIVLEVSQGLEEISANEYQIIDPRSLLRILVCNHLA